MTTVFAINGRDSFISHCIHIAHCFNILTFWRSGHRISVVFKSRLLLGHSKTCSSCFSHLDTILERCFGLLSCCITQVSLNVRSYTSKRMSYFKTERFSKRLWGHWDVFFGGNWAGLLCTFCVSSGFGVETLFYGPFLPSLFRVVE